MRGARGTAAAVCAIAFALASCGGSAPTPTPNPGHSVPPTNADGRATAGLDKSFGDTGRAFIDMGGTDDHAAAVVVQPDGRIVVAGAARPDANSLTNFALARFNTNGTVDPTLGAAGTGRVFTSFNDSIGSEALALAIQPDGKLLAAGHAPNTTMHRRVRARPRATRRSLEVLSRLVGRLSPNKVRRRDAR